MPNAVTILTARAGIARGCGVARTQGAVYLECGVGSTGLPLEHYLVDPPQPYDTDQKIGVSIVPDGKGTYHVIDWVGAEHYPMPNDFLEGGRLHGFSRKISRTTEFEKVVSEEFEQSTEEGVTENTDLSSATESQSKHSRALNVESNLL